MDLCFVAFFFFFCYTECSLPDLGGLGAVKLNGQVMPRRAPTLDLFYFILALGTVLRSMAMYVM